MPTGVYVRTEKHKQIISEAGIGRHIVFSEKHKQELSKVHFGIKLSKEHRQAISKGQTGRHYSIEQKRKMSKNRMGEKRSEQAKRNMSEAGIKRVQQQLLNGTTQWCNTKPEMLMYEGLLSRGYIVEKQKYIKTVGLVDFYLPDYNLVIEADGDYWHNLERQKIKDKRRNEKLKVLNYRILRFWEHDIKKNLQQCLNKIEEVTK